MQLLIVITALVSFLSVAESARDIRLTQKVHKLEPRTESNSPRQQILDNKVSSDTASPTSILAEGDNAKFRGPLSIAGGTLAHLALGTFYCWGNFMSYAPDYIKFYDGVGKKGAQPDALLILPLTLVSICVTMPLGPSLVSKVGASRAMLIGSWLMSLGVLLASYAKSLSTFMLFYSVMVGAGVGLAYTAPMTAAWKWMPQVKGLASGVILAGFGAGGFVFNLIGTKLVNPKGADLVDGKFPDEVYAGFPMMLRKLSVIYFTLTLLGSLMVSEPKKVTVAASGSGSKATSAATDVSGVSIMEAVRSPQFWYIWLMIVCSASAGLNVASIYKQFANSSPALAGDGYQALVGGIAALINGVGRLFWGILSDKIGFKACFIGLSLLQAALLMVYPSSTSSKGSFLAATSACFFLLAGNFSLMPPAMQRMFGPKNGAAIYGVIYSSFGVSSVGGLMLTKALSSSMGWSGIFKILSGFSVLAAIITMQLKPLDSYPGSSV